MLTIHLEATETEPATPVYLEHSLLSLSKWEQIYEKPFHDKSAIDSSQTATYIHCMLLDPKPKPNFISRMKASDFSKITDYINSPATATTINGDKNQRPSNEIVTSELIYFWMVSFRIPFQPCETWHLNRLMTLIKVCSIKNSKPKKMSPQERSQMYRDLNAKRREELGSSG